MICSKDNDNWHPIFIYIYIYIYIYRIINEEVSVFDSMIWHLTHWTYESMKMKVAVKIPCDLSGWG